VSEGFLLKLWIGSLLEEQHGFISASVLPSPPLPVILSAETGLFLIKYLLLLGVQEHIVPYDV